MKMDVDSSQIYENTKIFQISDNSNSESKHNQFYQVELPTKKSKSPRNTSFNSTRICFVILIETTIAFMTSTAVLVIKQYTNVTPCDSGPCLNGGTCSVYNDQFKCSCPSGYYGNQCQITPCSSSPCENNGRCIDINDSYGCLCQVGYSGGKCQVSGCSKYPCLNGGTCHVEAAGYTCSCRIRYSGQNCEKYFHQTLDSPNFPLSYPKNVARTWAIDVGNGYVVSIRFANFSTESGFDKLEIFNGGSTCSPKLAVLSGHILPNNIKTSGREAYMRFTTDGSAQYHGFRANIYKISIQ